MDSGGPRREFFRLLAVEGANNLFVGHQSMKFFDNNVTAIQISSLSFSICRHPH